MKDFSFRRYNFDTELHLPTRHIVQIILEGLIQIFRHRILQRIVVRRTRALSFRDRQELILLITQTVVCTTPQLRFNKFKKLAILKLKRKVCERPFFW